MSKLEQILVLALMIGIICGLGVASTMLRAHASGLDKVVNDKSKSDEPKEDKKSNDEEKQVKNDDEKKDDSGTKHKYPEIFEMSSKDVEKEKAAKEDAESLPDEEVAKQDKKDGNDLTVILKLKYGNLEGKWYSKVSIEVGKYFDKFYDLSKKPSKVTIKHLQIPEGRSFKVYVNNYKTDDGNQVNMHNSVCHCPETASIRVP